MVKSLIIAALLTSLFFLVKHLQPVVEPVVSGKVATSRQEKLPAEAQGNEPGGFNPVVVAPLPDVNNGYVFSEKRKYEKDDPANALKAALVEQGPDPLTTVLYSGSLIAGDLRRALVTYQELPKEADPRRSSPGRLQAPAAAQGVIQKKQLNRGDLFLGYVVAAVEPDRVVFEKGDRKVEKFLYDQGKKRMAPPEVSPQQALPTEIGGVPLSAMVPPEVLAALMAPPASGRNPQGSRVSGPTLPVDTPAVATDKAQDQAPPTPVLRRSQRLMGVDSLINVPVSPVPGLPVPNK
jgi:hypothetical protein